MGYYSLLNAIDKTKMTLWLQPYQMNLLPRTREQTNGSMLIGICKTPVGSLAQFFLFSSPQARFLGIFRHLSSFFSFSLCNSTKASKTYYGFIILCTLPTEQPIQKFEKCII